MDWVFAIALAIAVLVIFVPVAFIWFLNIGGLYHVMKEQAKKKETKNTGTERTAVRIG